MGLEDGVESWLFTVAARKVIVDLVKVGMAYIGGSIAQTYLTKFGVAVDPLKLQAELTTAGFAGITIAHDWLKLKGIIKF